MSLNPAGKNFGGASVRILHLEDAARDAALVEEVLRGDQLDVHVTRVIDRAGFVAALGDGPVDIILSDYHLLAYDGLSALAEAGRRAPDVPFVFVSSPLGEERAVETLKAGATDFVLKQHLARLPPAFRRALQESADRRARHEAEEALEDSRRFVESVIEATPHILFIFEPETRNTVYLNPKIADVLGYSPEALHGMGPGVLDADTAKLASGGRGLVVEREHRVRDATGRWRWIATRSVPFRSPRGELQILGTAEDVTDRRRVDRQRRVQYTVSRILATETATESALPRILEGLCGDLEFAVGEIWENDPEGRHQRRAAWHDPPRAAAAAWLRDSANRAKKPALTIPGRVVASARSHWIHDVADDPAYLRDQGAASMGLHTAVAVPLRAGADVLGVLVLFSVERLEADEDLVATLETLAGQVAEFWSRTRAERDRLLSEEKFRSIVETTSEWIWAVDAGFVLTYSNPAVKRILGYDAAQMIGRDRHAFVHAADREAVEVECEGLAYQGRGWDGLVVRWRHRDGSIRQLESTAVPVLDEKGAVTGYRGSDRDITARMETEEKLREQAMLLENAAEATLLTDADGRVRLWNRGAAELYEWTAQEAMGRDIMELLPGSPEKTYEARKRVLAGGSWTGMIHQRSRSGRDIAVQSRWSPVRGEDGRVRSILILNSDVTEAQRLEARLLRSQRMEGIGTLAGGIAHDLNNVLAPILMAIEVLARKITDPHGKRMLAILDTSARRGADLVKQVLTFARGASGTAGLLDPAHIIREMERMARETFPKSIEVHAEVPRDLWQVLGQATPLQQVLMNLCVNARDAMPNGGTLTLRAWNAPAAGDPADETRVPREHVVIEVSDTGTGIPPEVVNRIFDPFFTTKPMGEGTGLGLSTTAAIVKSHEGFIDVETKAGRGTAFKVFLPAHTSAVPAAIDLERDMPEGHGQLILVIDDEAAILNIARETLEVYGYSVLTASSGEDALGIFRERGKDIRLAVTDMSMPGLSGAATIQALRAIDPAVLIVATSGRPLEEPPPTIQAFLPKPYSARTLLETVQATIAAR